MRFRHFILASLAALVTLVSCEELVNLGLPSIKLSGDGTMTFEAAGGDQQITLIATRDWTVECDAEWLMISPDSGIASADMQTITITALENKGMDRTADVKFALETSFQTLTVTQAGPGGSAEALIVYSNDFDKELATQTYGSSGDRWPYLDQFDGWQNETGTGAGDVEYVYGGMSARNNAQSNGSYSDYEGSGNNNLLFSTNNYFAIKNVDIAPGSYTMSFGTEKYAGDGDNTFVPSEFHVYISADASKWVELTYSFPGDFKDGRWDIASSTFTLPEGTETLHMYFKSDLAGGHRIDDLKVVKSDSEGTAIDFSTGIEIEIGEGNTDSGDTGGDTAEKPETLTKATIAEFLAAEESSDVWYELTGEIISIAKTDYGNFTIKDETDEVYIYGMTNGWVGSNDKSFAEIGLNVGDVVTLGTLRGSYQGTPQGGGSKIPAYYISHVAGEGGSETPAPDAPEVPSEITSIADFLAASTGDTWYKLKGQIINIEKETYGNFTVRDENGDELFVYGLTKEYAESNDQSFASIGLKVGYYVTFVAQRGEYSGNPQAVGSFYVSHEEGELDLGDTVDFTKLTAAPSDWTGSYLIYMADNKAHGNVSGKDFAAVSDVLTDNGGVISAPEAYAVTIADAGDGKWSVELPNGKYLGLAHNSCVSSDSPVALGLEWTENGVKIFGEATNSGATNTYYLYYSTNNGEYIRFYVDKSSDDRYTLPTLYKK